MMQQQNSNQQRSRLGKLSQKAAKTNTDAEWQIISKGIQEIINHNQSQLSFEELYRNAYKMVQLKDGEKLYQNIKSMVRNNLNEIVGQDLAPLLVRSTPIPTIEECEGFLKNLLAIWDDHLLLMGMIRDIVMYLDRTFLPPRNLLSTFDMGLDLFRDHIIKNCDYNVEQSILSAVMNLLYYDRQTSIVDRELLRNVVRIFSQLPSKLERGHGNAQLLYSTLLEPVFLENSCLYFKGTANDMVTVLSSREYLEKTQIWLDEEQSRITKIFSEATASKTILILHEKLIAEQLQSIMTIKNRGLEEMVMGDDYEGLQLFYKIFGLVNDGYKNLSNFIALMIKKAGQELKLKYLDEKAADPVQWLDDISRVQQKYHTILDKSFSNNIQIVKDINVALKEAINSQSNCAELISSYADKILKQNTKGMIDSEAFEPLVDKCISVLCFLQEKDVFERYFKKSFAKRLLYTKNLNHESEKLMLSKLKAECGYQATSRLEGMFTDVHISSELTHKFKSYIRESATKYPDLYCNVLTNTFWPLTHADSQSHWPDDLLSVTRKFENFYASQHQGRRLMWLPNFGTVDLWAHFKSGKKDLNMSTQCAMVLLMAFNNEENSQHLFQDILNITNMETSSLKRVLLSLALGKFRILTKHSPGKDVDSSTSFSVNVDFANQHNRIKILMISGDASSAKQEEIKEREETLNRIGIERQYEIEASIVRVMKARKTVDHNNLVSQVIEQLSNRFNPEPQIVKQKIESLIEREYIERDENARNIYNYIA